MKRIALFLLIAGSVLITSCEGRYNTKVTVVRKSVSTLAKLREASINLQTYDAVTQNGDTTTVTVPEKIASEHTLPYQALMVKDSGSPEGRITGAL